MEPVQAMPAQAQASSVTNWMDSIKETLLNWYNKLDLNSNKVIELASYFAVAFFIGFILKRHARILFSCAIVLTIALLIFAYFDLAFINWSKVRELTNISPNDTLGTLIENCIIWVKQNIILVISALLGILFGYKIG
ncbi:MAG: hypothetical protein P4L22_05985 [Candidatus Babeliales bacterium]|nr:hypothetical protein [Candidatus Babeliales bacterium]